MHIHKRCLNFSDSGRLTHSLPDLEHSTVNSRYLEVVGTIFYKFKLPEVQNNLHVGKFGLVKSIQRQIMVGESNQNVISIQIDASSFAEFVISEFEISRFGCILY